MKSLLIVSIIFFSSLTTANFQKDMSEAIRYFSNPEESKENLKKAYYIFKKYEESSLTAKYYVAESLLNGYGISKNEELAFKIFEKTALAGNLLSQYRLGLLLIEEDNERGVRWLEKSALSNPYAAFKLGRMYTEGDLVTQNKITAIKWFTTGSNMNHGDSQYELAKNYLSSSSRKSEGLKWLILSAQKGTEPACEDLSKMYKKGLYVEINFVEHVKWLTCSAQKGNIYSQKKIASYYRTGNYVVRNRSFDKYWSKKASLQGDAESLYVVGYYEMEDGNENKMLDALSSSANKDNKDAAFLLGYVYEVGKLVNRDESRALRYYEQANELGHENALSKIIKLTR
jgi:TPR repeat protein